MSAALIEAIFEAVVEGDEDAIAANVQAALDAGIETTVILNQGLIAAMDEVGRRFQTGEYFVPEMLLAALTMQAGLVVLRPLLLSSGAKARGKIVLGTVKGDLHDIGKNLVGMMLEGVGFEIIDLGTDVRPETFVAAVNEHQPDLIGLSALLTTTIPNMKTTIDALAAAGLRDRVKVLVGGAPVTELFANQIGADGYAADAGRAAVVAKAMVPEAS